LQSFIDPKTVSKLIFIAGDVSDGSENDSKLREVIGDDWKVLTGADQPVLSTGCSPGFDFEKFYNVCKIGNPNRLLALNSWLYPIVSEWQDYWAAEVYSLGIAPENKIVKSGPGKGLQFQSLIALQGDWVHSSLNSKVHPNRLSSEELIKYISSCEGKGPVTINIEIYQDGSLGEESMATMEKIKQQLKK
jgi:hypothetical protein